MASGLRIWDASGNLVVDENSSLTRVLGIDLITNTALNNGMINHAAFALGIPYAVVSINGVMTSSGSPSWSFYPVAPEVWITGTTLYWEWDLNITEVYRNPFRIIYGIR